VAAEEEHGSQRRRRGAGAPRPRGSSPRLGAIGERHAAEHLERLGFAILARNARTAAGELDLVAFDAHTLVFAEVKTARAGSSSDPAAGAGGPLARLGSRQRARIRRLAAAWLREPRNPRPRALELRLDAVGVIVDERGRLVRLDHVEGWW
jgi:putative endonuclease